jgi:hypothetical protein
MASAGSNLILNFTRFHTEPNFDYMTVEDGGPDVRKAPFALLYLRV